MSYVSIKDKLKEKIKEKQKQDIQNIKSNMKDPLFDNPQFMEMKNSLPESEQKKYEDAGNYLYNAVDVNFDEKGQMQAAIDTVSQIKIMLNSGLHPSYLTKEEKEFLENYIGKEWYKDFGYLENDLNRINF